MGAYEFQGPSVRVISPNGGETVAANVSYNITWEVSPTVNETYIRLSTNEGTTWDTLVTHETGSYVGNRTYNWMVNDLPSKECLISIEAKEADNSIWNYDASNALFEIKFVTITNLTIEVVAENGGKTQRDVRLFWEGGSKCDVWVHNGSFTSSSEIYDCTGRYTKTYVNHTSGDVIHSFDPTATPATQEYFAVAPAGMNSNFAETIAGRFDVEVSRDDPSKVYISVPLVMYHKNVQKVLTTQAKNGDAIYIFDVDGSAISGAVYIDGTWYDWASGLPSALDIDMTQGYAVLLGGLGASSRTFTFAGTISASPEISRNINKEWQMIGRAYPVGKPINNAGLNGLSAGGPLAQIYQFDINGGIVNNQGALHFEQATWYDWATGDVSTMNLIPGQAYWVYEPASTIAWKQKP
jgi:hypothetical protein